MTITSLDIQNKEFERSFRGYDIEDVDEFLDQVAKDLEELMRENAELKDNLVQLQEKNKNYQKLEETMHNAIVVAQETAEEVKLTARREADLIRREAENQASHIVEEARYRAGKIMTEKEELFKQAQVFKMRFRSFIEAQLSALENEDWLEEAKKYQASEKTVPRVGDSIETEKENKFSAGLESEPPLDSPRSEPKPEIKPEPSFSPDPDLDFDRDPEF
jgi:cell division initiation protein